MRFQDYYAILGIPPTASLDMIREAYRKLSSFSHPDRFADPTDQHWANERMKQINEAYAVLSDPAKRSVYDRSHSVEHGVAGTKTGTHQSSGTILRCPACVGEGETSCLTCDGAGTADCPGCYGQHRVTCFACGGTGILNSQDYERLVEELLRAEPRGQVGHTAHAARRQSHPRTQDPFWQPGYWDRQQPRPELRPAPLLSLFIPGAGQLLNGEPQKALTYFGIVFFLFIGIGLFKGLGLLLLMIFWVYNIYDANVTSTIGSRGNE